jgi:tripartite-type tricarboxylate transporter receptor subunit TctC
MFDAPNIALPHLRSGKLRALATTGRTRHRLLPEVPAVNETLPGYEVIGWMGVVGPAGLPVAAQRRLAAEIEKTLAAPDTADRIAALGLDVSYGGPQELGQAIRRDLALWGPVIKASGLRLD